MREERREKKRPFPPPSPAARRRRIPGERREVLRGAKILVINRINILLNCS
jgi:hypothetical protein